MAELAYLQISRVCNQKCRFCSNPSNGRLIGWEEARAWIDRFAQEGWAGVILTGGEPTLFPELARLVAYARGRGLATRLITNGQRTADRVYLESLAGAGLTHMHVSIHSHEEPVQAFLTQNQACLGRIRGTLDNAGALGLRVDINTVINKKNAAGLDALVEWLLRSYPFLGHFVWNNLDPLMGGPAAGELVARLRDFELSLHRAMEFLDRAGRTFRVERVPLCFMSEFPHRSTETRKIVKREKRSIYFLDEKGLHAQGQAAWRYGKGPLCASCRAAPVCAGLYQMDRLCSSAELCPIFTSPESVAQRVLQDG
ncbi:MAG: radical SAM protein [Elusimicrobia bacterium]|nr:radical SAM protein [Elusimicrobiota bacterium]